jgi:hypothetical protein
MPRRFALTLLFAFLPLALSAQTMTSIRGSGETIILPNMPFHAERVTHMERKLSDNSVQSREEHETIDRDSAGRVFVESRIVTSGGVPSAKPIIMHLLIDPVARTFTNWSTASTTAMTQPFSRTAHLRITASPLTREEPITPPKGDPPYQVTTEDLGRRTIAGLVASGTRTTTILPAARFSTAGPLAVSHEIWTSPDLQMTLLEVDKSPFSGTTTSEVVSLTRTEPDASLFHVPDGLTIKSFPNGGVTLGTP